MLTDRAKRKKALLMTDLNDNENDLIFNNQKNNYPQIRIPNNGKQNNIGFSHPTTDRGE